MIQFNNTEKGRYKTVDISQLASHPGWRLIALVSHTTHEPVNSFDLNGRPVPAGTRVEETTRAVLFQDEGSALAEAAENAKLLAASCATKRDQIEVLERDLRHEKARVKELEANIGAHIASAVAMTRAMGELNAVKRKLEGDLAKVRQHFGEKAFNEAIGSEK